MPVVWWLLKWLVFAFDALWLLAGCGAVLLASYFLVGTLVKLLTWRRAVARVNGFKREEGGFFPLLTYSQPSGEQVEATAITGRGARGYSLGDTVRVLIDPRDARRVEVFAIGTICLPVIATVAIAVVFVLVAAHNWQRMFVYP